MIRYWFVILLKRGVGGTQVADCISGEKQAKENGAGFW